jgi:hypothetical protein
MQALTDEQKRILSEWLTRLTRTQDFKGHLKELAITVCNIVQDVDKEPFKSAFFAQAEVDNTNCDDRASMALNISYLLWLLLRPGNEALPFEEKKRLLNGVGKTLALRVALAQLIDEQQKKQGRIEQESVEIYLYYEQLLQEKLGLITATKTMHYTPMGKRSWIDPANLERLAGEAYLDQVVELPIFDTILNGDPEAKKQLEEVKEQITLPVQNANEAEGVYLAAAAQCNIDRQIAERNFKKTWWQQKCAS